MSVEDPALLIRVAWSRRWQSRQNSVACAERAKTLLDSRKDEKSLRDRARADLTLAWQAEWRGQYDDALALALDAERHLSETDFPSERAELYGIIGTVHRSRNRLDLADGAVKRGLGLVQDDCASDTYAGLLVGSASIHKEAGDLRSTGEVLGKARNIATGATLCRVEQEIACWMYRDKAPKHALEHAKTSLMLCETHRNAVVLPYAHAIAGACLVELENLETAKEHFRTGLELATVDADWRIQCQILGWYAGLEEKQDSLERARDLYRYGTEIAKRMESTALEKDFARRLAGVYQALGDLPNAVECHNRAWKLEEEKRL